MKHFVVNEGDKPLPIIVFSSIKPTHPLNFLLHVALSLGEFSNGLELFGDSTDIHDIFHSAIQCLAELALISIYKSPEAMLMLMTFDVLFIDELGHWSDGYIAVIDIILRCIGGSNAFLEVYWCLP
jgi:hypothetical protein